MGYFLPNCKSQKFVLFGSQKGRKEKLPTSKAANANNCCTKTREQNCTTKRKITALQQITKTTNCLTEEMSKLRTVGNQKYKTKAATKNQQDSKSKAAKQHGTTKQQIVSEQQNRQQHQTKQII